jgi:hypothetical protein
MGMLEPVDGTNLTTALLKATTINNDAYGVLAGQDVEILLIDLNAAIPTVIVGQESASAFTTPLADMAFTIASSRDLLDRISSFTADETENLSSGSSNGRLGCIPRLVLTLLCASLAYFLTPNP